jgi:hypothetical protein
METIDAALTDFRAQVSSKFAVTPYELRRRKMNQRMLVATGMLGLMLGTSAPAHCEVVDASIASCLRAWGTHPFGTNPAFRTLASSVKVFGIGENPSDTTHTDSPSLILVNPGVNVMGSTTLELLNPNGWYCFRSNVNVMGKLRIRVACKAHLASASDGVTVLSSNPDQKSVAVLGSTQVELVGCE